MSDGRADDEEDPEDDKGVGERVVLPEAEENADDIARNTSDEEKGPSLHVPI